MKEGTAYLSELLLRQFLPRALSRSNCEAFTNGRPLVVYVLMRGAQSLMYLCRNVKMDIGDFILLV